MQESTTELRSVYQEVLGESKIDDGMVTVDLPDGQEVSIEFCDFEDFRGFNVASFRSELSFPDWFPGSDIERDVGPEDVAERVDLEVEDSGDIFVLLVTDADDADQALDDLDSILDALGTSRENISSLKRRNIEQGGVVGWLHDKIVG